MKVIITGGAGLIARYIVREFARLNYSIVVVVSKDRLSFANDLYKDIEDLIVVSSKKYFQDDFQKDNIPNSIVIHTAFTRENNGKSIAKSLQYSSEVFEKAKANKARGVINISSRSVYEESNSNKLVIEDDPLDDDSLIATAKHGTELLLKAFFKNTNILYTNVRIASVNELKTDNNMIRPLNVFVDCVLSGDNIQVFGGSQILSFVDPRDVAHAIEKICSSSITWQDTYNIGAEELGTEKILRMAQRVVEIGEALGYKKVDIVIIDKKIKDSVVLCIDRLRNDFAYEPLFSLDDMIYALFEMKRGNNG